MSSAVIECRDVVKSYRTSKWKKLPVLTGVNLEVSEGECFTLLGSNGAGKSTLIRLLMNITSPGTGEATVFGRPCHKLQSTDYYSIGYVSEAQEIPRHFTIQSWLKYIAPLYPSWDRDFADQLMKTFDLDPKKKIRNLSRGMRMKVALISAIAYRPRLLLLDEPFSGLDPLVRDEFVQGILEVTEGEGWTIFMATHDLEEVDRLTDRVGILEGGKMVLNESVDLLRSRFIRVHISLPTDQVARHVEAEFPKGWIDIQQESNRLFLVESQFKNRALSTTQIKELFGEEVRVEFIPVSIRDTFVSVARSLRTGNSLEI